MRFHSRSPAETRAVAQALAVALGDEGLVVGLCGPLGAGKTVFAKGVAEGLGIDPEQVSSPTFVIAQELCGERGRRLCHVDLYRIESEAELEAAGWRDWLAPGAVVLVEWADRFAEALPDDHLVVALAPAGSERPEARELLAHATGPTAAAALARWEAVVLGAGRREEGGAWG